MANIVPKLNLNKTPSIVDNNSLVFAKNIRADVDGTLHKDYSITPLSLKYHSTTEDGNDLYESFGDILGHIIRDTKNLIITDPENTSIYSYYLAQYELLKEKRNWKIVGIISNTSEFYIFINGTVKTEKLYKINCIVRYDETIESYSPCNCAWRWNGGTITGCVINNLIGEKIIIIGEKANNAKKLIPLKCINLNQSKHDDDETIYTQTPNVPYTNLKYTGTFTHTVPNGVYQFFVRYKIRENFYTDWFPASKPIFIGNRYVTNTSFGAVSYLNPNVDSDYSVILDVEHVLDNTCGFENFQIGYLLSHEDTTIGRAWKHFNIKDDLKIYFDWKETDVIEVDVTDFTKPTYQLYNVGNITNFKNKVYISNYTETDFNDINNPDLQTSANAVDIKIERSTDNEDNYGDYPCNFLTSDKVKIVSLKLDNNDTNYTPFSGENGIIHKLLIADGGQQNFKSLIKNIISNTSGDGTDIVSSSYELYNIRLNSNGNTLYAEQEEIKRKAVDTETIKYIKKPSFNKGIDKISFSYSNSDIDQFTDITVDEENIDAAVNTILEYIYNNVYYLNNKAIFEDRNERTIENINISIYRTYTYKAEIWYPNGFVPDINTGETVNENNQVHNKISSDLNIPNFGDKPIPPGGNNSGIEIGGEWKTEERTESYVQNITIQIVGEEKLLNSVDNFKVTKYTTLIPYQKYKFYIHFIKHNGEVTNGFECKNGSNGIITVPYYDNCDNVIYPIFKNINIPIGYDGCFFSILHCETKTVTICDIINYYHDTNTFIATEGTAFDINTRKIPLYESMNIRQGDNVAKGKYYYSGDSSTARYFGADGVVKIGTGEENKDFGEDYNVSNLTAKPIGKIAYAINEFTISNDKSDYSLIKCTPYFSRKYIEENKTNGIQCYENYDLNGYICNVSPLNRERCTEFYSDGSTLMYKKNPYDSEDKSQNNTAPAVPQFKEVSTHEPKVSDIKTLAGFDVVGGRYIRIYSNYNYNFIQLTEEPNLTFKTYYAKLEGDTEKDDETYSRKILLKTFKSLAMSSVYTISKTYTDFTRKTYIVKNTDDIFRFDNTIRSSELPGDEAKLNIFKFNAEDYYNVPPSRGKIVNLVGVGDNIIAHTEDSMFKFTGSNTISSSEGEIKTNESEPFDTGISEAFGSDFGYAGIQNKEHYVLSENGYIFFDANANTIFIYSGQGQLAKISDSIEKLLRRDKISNIHFANDYYNNRFFVNVVFKDNNSVTLSFCTHPNIKSFISIHDFSFTKAFNTRTKCYFLANDEKDILTIDKSSHGFYNNLTLSSDRIYPMVKDSTELRLISNSGLVQLSQRYLVHSILDIIQNSDYETIKTLDSIEWCSRFVKAEFERINANDYESIKMADIIEDDYPCFSIRIYTDTCITPLMTFDYKNANDFSISNPDSYKYPRYNQGKFNLNYFRNIQNANGNLTPYISDDNSLVEGKYIVVRFLFNKDFKFETLTLNCKDKL